MVLCSAFCALQQTPFVFHCLRSLLKERQHVKTQNAFPNVLRFFSRDELEKRLDGSGIHLINKISGPKVHTKAELLGFLETESMYRGDGGKVEGVYVRIDNGQWHESRGKIVRPDFIQNIEDHWMKSELVKNEVRMDLY